MLKLSVWLLRHTVSCVLSNCYRLWYSVSGSRVVPAYTYNKNFMGELLWAELTLVRGKPRVVQGLWLQVEGSLGVPDCRALSCKKANDSLGALQSNRAAFEVGA